MLEPIDSGSLRCFPIKNKLARSEQSRNSVSRTASGYKTTGCKVSSPTPHCGPLGVNLSVDAGEHLDAIESTSLGFSGSLNTLLGASERRLTPLLERRSSGG